jgi:hypothetical protein
MKIYFYEILNYKMKTKLFTIALALVISFGAKAQSHPAYPNVSLWNIQYSTVDSVGAIPNSPYTNQYVNTGGIITGKFGYGYYVQTSNAHEWAAVNVYDRTYSPAVGDSVTFTGQVTEYYNETEMDSISNFVIVSSGNQALTPVTYVGLDSIQRRKYQALLVKIKDASCVRYNAAAVWWVFSDSTMTDGVNSEDTIDNIIYSPQHYTPGKRYDITGCVHHEYANWIEPRNKNDIDSVNVFSGIMNYQNNAADISVFPNPNNGKFTLSITSRSISGTNSVEIYNMLGEKVYSSSSIQHPTFNINLSSLPAGIYLYRVLDTNGILLGEGKIIVQR